MSSSNLNFPITSYIVEIIFKPLSISNSFFRIAFLQYFAKSLKNNSISKDSFAKLSSSFIISYSFSFNILFKNIFILELGVIPKVSSAIFKFISLPFAVTISLSKIEIESLILPEEFS